jgi:hypothetical protein
MNPFDFKQFGASSPMISSGGLMQQLAKGSANEFRLMHIPTKTVIATINAKSS